MKWIIVLLVLFCLYQEHDAQGGTDPATTGPPTGTDPATTVPPKVVKPKGTRRPPPKKKPKKPHVKRLPKAYGCPNPDTWTRYKDSDRCYFVGNETANFADASLNCNKMNAELISPLTCHAEVLLSSLLSKRHTDSGEFWIGISRTKQGGNWVTVGGVDLGVTGRFWADDYPKDAEGNCVVMSFYDNWKYGEWKNTNCDRSLKSVCVRCPNDYTYIADIDQCLHLNANLSTWKDAGNFCDKTKYRSHLLSIENGYKQSIVHKFASSLFKGPDLCTFGDKGKTAWIGGQRLNASDCNTTFFWNIGRPAETNFTFTSWVDDFPPTCTPGGKDACISMSEKNNYSWAATDCETKLCSVCEFY